LGPAGSENTCIFRMNKERDTTWLLYDNLS